MWSSDEEEEEDERVLRSPSPSPQPPSSTSNLRRRRGRRDSSLLRRAASLQMVNRDRKFSTSSREKEDRTSHTGGWYQDSVRRASSRASLRDTSPSPPPVIASRNKRWSSYAQRRTSAYEPRAGYSSKEEEPGDDEYDVDDDDDTQSSMSKSRKDYYLSLEELVNRRRSKNVKNQGIEILRLVKEAERANFNAEDLQVAIHQCGLSEPVQWLRDNWKTMIDTVTTLASRKDNGIGAVSSAEAKDALRVHKGNIWAAVTDCIETRQKKVKELLSRSGNLSREEVTAALTASAGDVEEAALQMNKTSLKPFLMRIYGPPTGIENEAGAIRNLSSTSTSGVKRFHELFDKPQAESYGNPEDSCSEGSSYLMEGDGQLDDEEMSYLDDINPSLIKELDAQIEMKSGQVEIGQQVIKDKNRNESEILQVKSNHKTHLEKQALLNSTSAIQIDSHRITNDKHKVTEKVHEFVTEKQEAQAENSKITTETQEASREHCKVPKENTKIPVENREVPKEKHEIPVGKYEIPVEMNEIPVKMNENPVEKYEVPVEKCEVLKEDSKVTVVKQEVQMPKCKVSKEKCDIILEKREVSEKKHEVPVERCEVPMEKIITVENHEVSKVQHKVLMEEHEVPMEKCEGNKKLELPTQNQTVQMVNRNEAKESDTISQEICEASHEHDSHMVNYVNANAKQWVAAKIDNAEKMNELPTDRCEVSNDCDDIHKEISSIQEEDRVVSDKLDNDHVISEGRHDTLQTTQNAPNMKTGMVSDEQEVSQIKQEVQTDTARTVNHKFDMEKLRHENINENLKSESVTIVEMNKPQVAKGIANMQMSNENEVDTYVNSASTKCEHQYQEVDLFEVENPSADVLQNEGTIKNETPDISLQVQSEEIGIKNDTVTDKHINIQNDMIEQSSMDSAEVEPCCTQSEVFYDAFPDPIYEPAVAKLIENNNPVRFISQSQVRHTSTLNVTMSQQMPSTAIVHQPQHSQPIDKTAAVIAQQGKPEVIVKTLFVRTGIPTVITNRLESVSELVAQELAEAVELIEYASTLTEDLFVVTSNVDSGHNYMNKNDYQLLLPVETRFAEVIEAVVPHASVILDASTSQIKPSNQPAIAQVQSAVKGKAVIPLATAEPKASTSQAKTSNQPAVVQVPLVVKKKAVMPLASVAPEASTSQIKPSNQPAIVQVPLAVKGKAVIPLASVEPMDSTSQIKPSNQPAIVEVQSAVKAKAVDEFLPPAKEDTDDSSTVPSSASELGQTETEDDDDEDEVEPMEPPLPVKPDLGRRARQFLAEGKLPNYYKAELAVKLLDLRFEESEAIFAANECSDLYMAVSYLQQDCELCAGRFPMGKMISMLNCVHRCCRACAKDYFTLKIKERNILETGCPFCCEPDLSDDEVATLYFNHLDIMLKNLVEADVHELFQRKLRDRALMNEPNFRWCDKCGSGFIGDPNRRRIVCPDCKVITCGHCNKPWEKQHEGISCQQFEEWRLENDPEYQKQGLESYLAENGIHCPKCKFKYDLAKGGCMHFTCSQCKFEFCSGCGKAFRMAGKCLVSQRCEKLGLHAHHPRNCLFYLRDKDPEELKKLLDEHHIKYDEGDDGSKQSVKCAVLEQREIPDGHEDAVCGREVEAKQAGLCRSHYVEYLVSLVGEHKVDPVSIMDGAALEQELRRKEKKVPERKPGELPEEYREVLVKVVLKEIPLEDTEVPYLARRPSKIVT